MIPMEVTKQGHRQTQLFLIENSKVEDSTTNKICFLLNIYQLN